MDPLENIQNKNIGQPKLPDDYWAAKKNEQKNVGNIFDENLNVSLKDISIFNKD